jgi:hypothetical protein
LFFIMFVLKLGRFQYCASEAGRTSSNFRIWGWGVSSLSSQRVRVVRWTRVFIISLEILSRR